MDIDLIKLLCDTGLFILIWMVQLVVYPSFNYYSEEEIKRWHKLYTFRISIVVLPLMLGQLVLYTYTVFKGASFVDYGLSFCVLLTWVVTFLVSVPLHGGIEREPATLEIRKKLVNTNWIRTVLWSIIFIISYIEYAK